MGDDDKNADWTAYTALCKTVGKKRGQKGNSEAVGDNSGNKDEIKVPNANKKVCKRVL